MTIMKLNLLKDTLELAKHTQLTPDEIGERLNVTARWYYKFINGEIKNPGVIHVQNLFNLLSETTKDNRNLTDRRKNRRIKTIN